MKDERRPVGRPSEDSAAAKPLELFAADCTAGTDNSVGQQLRRHRLAAARCEPLADGRRSPLEKKPTPSRVVWVEIGPKNTAAVTGERIFPAIKKLGLPYQWHALRQDVLCIPANQAGDLIAYLEHRCRRRVEVVNVERI